MIPSDDSAERLSLATILIYGAPAAGLGFMMFFVSSYLMIFATDVLLIPPAAMGVIFLVSRLWDAVSDPVAGYLSDRTVTSLGRRRPWLIAGALPAGALFALLFYAPPSLQGTQLVLWTGVCFILFYTSLTVLMMPHDSLGAELSTRYEDRNRIFGWRRVLFGVGAVVVFAAVTWLRGSGDEERALAFRTAAAAGLVVSLLFLMTGVLMRERPEYRGRGASNPFSAIRDVARNPHARLLLAVFFTQQMAIGALVAGLGYFTSYILGDPALLGQVMGFFFVASIAAVPVWMALGRRFEKKTLALVAMIVVALSLSCLLWIGPGDTLAITIVTAVAGAFGACLDVVFPSIQADVIDADELETGERKEGVYFAAWALAAKSALGLGALLLATALELGGFVPNVEQTEASLLAIRLAVGGAPVVAYVLGVVLFARFGLDRRRYDEIRAALDARAALDS